MLKHINNSNKFIVHIQTHYQYRNVVSSLFDIGYSWSSFLQLSNNNIKYRLKVYDLYIFSEGDNLFDYSNINPSLYNNDLVYYEYKDFMKRIDIIKRKYKLDKISEKINNN